MPTPTSTIHQDYVRRSDAADLANTLVDMYALLNKRVITVPLRFMECRMAYVEHFATLQARMGLTLIAENTMRVLRQNAALEDAKRRRIAAQVFHKGA